MLEQSSSLAVIKNIVAGNPLTKDEALALIDKRKEEFALFIPASYSEDIQATMFSGAAETKLTLVIDAGVASQFSQAVEGAVSGLSQQAAMQGMISQGMERFVEELRARGATVPTQITQKLITDIAQIQGAGEEDNEVVMGSLVKSVTRM